MGSGDSSRWCAEVGINRAAPEFESVSISVEIAGSGKVIARGVSGQLFRRGPRFKNDRLRDGVLYRKVQEFRYCAVDRSSVSRTDNPERGNRERLEDPVADRPVVTAQFDQHARRLRSVLPSIGTVYLPVHLV